MAKPIDIETALGFSIQTYAVPLPVDFELPCALITRTGGSVTSRVIDAHAISVDVYAETWEQAAQKANALTGEIITKEGTSADGVTIGSVECTLPYINPDPAHESVPRVTFTARITCRGI